MVVAGKADQEIGGLESEMQNMLFSDKNAAS